MITAETKRLFLPSLYRWKNEVSVMLLTEFDQKSYDNGLIKVGVERERRRTHKKYTQYVHTEYSTGNNSEDL